MSVLPGHRPRGFVAETAVLDATVTYVSKNSDSVDRPTYTFTSQAIGSGTTSSHLVLFVTGGGSATSASVTVGGSSCTLLNSLGGTREMFIIQKPTASTTANVVVSFSGGDSNRCGLIIWRVDNLQSTTLVDNDTGQVSSSTAPYSVSHSAGGVVIGACFCYTGVSSISFTGMTEETGVETDLEGGRPMSGASVAQASAGTTSGNITTNTSQNIHFNVVSLR